MKAVTYQGARNALRTIEPVVLRRLRGADRETGNVEER